MAQELTIEQKEILKELLRDLLDEKTYTDTNGNVQYYITWEEYFVDMDLLIDSETWKKYCQRRLIDYDEIIQSRTEANQKDEEEKLKYQTN